MRKVFTSIGNSNGRKAVVYRNSEFDCFIVKFYSFAQLTGNYVQHEHADYESNDKEDAIGTAMNWTH